MLKKLLLMVGLACSPSYSYSESIAPYYGTTGNAASSGNSWSMDGVLPTPPGLDINGVIYDYTIQKNVDDSVNVHIQNENAAGTGYIFRETDEWQSGSLGGTEIRKVVPVAPGIPRTSWGQGSIEVDGNGSVQDPSVVYMYKVDPCYDPQFDPNCPGYEIPVPVIATPEIEIYDATEDEYVSLSTEELILLEENEEILEDEEEKEKEEAEKRKRQLRLEQALSIVDNSEMFANSFAAAQQLAALDAATRVSQYYSLTIPGGVYNDTQVLVDKKIDDNKQGLRNGLAQQLLHEQMIQSQYD